MRQFIPFFCFWTYTCICRTLQPLNPDSSQPFESGSLNSKIALQFIYLRSQFLLPQILLLNLSSNSMDLTSNRWISGSCSSLKITSLWNTAQVWLVNLDVWVSHVLSKFINLVLSAEEFLLLRNAAWGENALTDVLSIVLNPLERIFWIDSVFNLANVSIIVLK